MFVYSAKLLIRYESRIKKCWDIEGLKHLCLMVSEASEGWACIKQSRKSIKKKTQNEENKEFSIGGQRKEVLWK